MSISNEGKTGDGGAIRSGADEAERCRTYDAKGCEASLLYVGLCEALRKRSEAGHMIFMLAFCY